MRLWDDFREQSHPARSASPRKLVFPNAGGRKLRRVQPPGRSVFSDNTWRLLAGSLELSRRESQILRAVFDDQKESAIAVSLGISSHTVHTYLERLYRKLGVTSRVTLVSRVFVEYLSLEAGRRRLRQNREDTTAIG